MTESLEPRDAAAPAPADAARVDPIAAVDPAPAEADLPPVPTDPGDVALLGLVDRMAALLDRSELDELEVQVGGTGLVLRKPVPLPPVAAPSAAGTPGAAGAGDGAGQGGAPAAPARPSVKAPLTGIWYASPSPGSSPYVVVGGEIAVGQVVGLIEAMKLFNEIKSDLAGRVAKVHAESGKLVKAKQPLIEVDPL
jgi:acetyl-CoA carboxylase biotin carboxyl carrier protein